MIRSLSRLLLCAAFAVFMAVQTSSAVFASGNGIQTAGKTLTLAEQLASVSSPSYILTEMQTGTVLYEKNADKKIYQSHLAKLMTLLLLAEKMDIGEVTKDDVFTATERANAQNDPQIWLDKGEKITSDELIKAITVGNANDAAVTIAENLCKSEKEFVAEMNSRAKQLNMDNTHFADSTGVNKGNVTTARDLSKLCSELVRFEFLTPYLKTWLVNVRSGKAELVNSNRLVRNYKGITGMKACSSKESGSCGCVTADKGQMKLCAVVLGCADNDKRDEDIKKLLKCGAEGFQLYSPEIPKELLQSIPVTHGEELECELKAECEPLVIIKRGTASELTAESKREELLEAPVEQGQVCAVYSLYDDKKCVFTVNIVSANSVGKMNWKCAIKKLLYNLIKL